jgi:diguanylate cyclase (GGDEF)-like protein/PAS domain S-box-containing protein
MLEFLQRREGVLMAASFAAGRFLTGDWRTHIDEVLEQLGVAADVSRVYIFENHLNAASEKVCSQRYEWCAESVTACLQAPEWQETPLAEGWFAEWARQLEMGQVVGGDVRLLPEPHRQNLEPLDVRSLVIVPIFSDDRWWGYIGFDECRTERLWDAAEEEVLRLVADLIGAAVSHSRASAALRESEAELRAIFAAMRDVILVIDHEYRYQKIAPTDPSLLYKPPHELLGRTLHETFSQEIADRFAAYIDEVLKTGRTLRAEYSLCIDERNIWFEASITRLNHQAVVLVARDITENIEAKRLFQQQAAAMNASMDGMAILTSEGHFVFLNEACVKMFGYARAEQLMGKSWELLYPPAEQRRFNGEIVPQFMSEGQWRGSAVGRRRNGTQFPQEISLNQIADGSIICVVRDITEAHAAQEALRESEARFRLLAENSTDLISRLGLDGKFLYASPACHHLLGYTAEQMLLRTHFEITHPGDLKRTQTWHLEVQAGHDSVLEYRMLRSDGSFVWFETHARAIRDVDGAVIEIQTVSRDITERRHAEEALRQAEVKYRSIFENAVEGIFQTTPDGRYMDANPSLARIYGYESSEDLIRALTDIGRQLYVEPLRRAEFVRLMNEQGRVSDFESQIYRRDGEIIWISENARAVYDDEGRLLFYEGTVEDITKRKVAEEQLMHDALHDKLTGLANRVLFMDRLGQAMARLKRYPENLFAVLFLDFDRFKNVNDSLGHLAGDQFLINVSKRLSFCLRPGDTIARLGGDEFAILLEAVKGVEDATIVAERIQRELKHPFRLAGQSLFSSASIGIALANPEYARAEDLLRDADMAMYRAKALGKARHEVFDAGMHTRAVALLQLETDLRWAIERKEFHLLYQPIVSLDDGHIVGFEALIRWRHPERGIVSPNEFIPVAEETGFIVPIGQWVLEEACNQLAQWQAKHPADPPLYMAVNLSGRQFSQPDLIENIERVLREHQLPPNSLKLEITESAIMENAEAVTERLLHLRALGVRLGLDDFGTGYSSLSYLHRFPLDTLKIDRSFVSRMLEGGENREIVRTIVALGRNLNMDVIAEGVEGEAQLSDLRRLECAHGQGFYFARPLAADHAAQMLIENPRW